MTRSRVMGTPCDHASFFPLLLVWRSPTFSLQKKKVTPDRSLRYCPLEVTKPRDKDTWRASQPLHLFITYVQRKSSARAMGSNDNRAWVISYLVIWRYPSSISQPVFATRRVGCSKWAPERLLVPVHFFARSLTGNERVKIKNKMAEADERRVLSLFVIDAFTSKPFSGNPGAVCLVGSKVRFSLLS